MKRKLDPWRLLPILWASLCCGFILVGCSKINYFLGPSGCNESVVGVVFDEIRDRYVEEVNDTKLVQGALQGALSSLDPFSLYLPPESFDLFTKGTKGKYGGLGLEVVMTKFGIKIIAPMDGGPAEKAGLQPGDLIVKVNGESVTKFLPIHLLQMLQGEPNTSVKLTIVRKSGEPFDVTLIRKIIEANPITALADGDILYVRISHFNNLTKDKLVAEVKKFQAEKRAHFKGLIIDVRNNPGGTLEQAVENTNLFLSQGVIVSIKGRNAREAKVFHAKGNDILGGLPIVVLINGGSASASEILAGAFKDHKRAILVGEKTFGKGSVQSVIQIPGCGGMTLTTGKFFTPNGSIIHEKGIEPDVKIEAAKPKAMNVDQAVEKMIQERRSVDVLRADAQYRKAYNLIIKSE